MFYLAKDVLFCSNFVFAGFPLLFFFIFSFRPVLPISYVQSELALESEEECQAFLAPLSLIYAGNDISKIDCKQSLVVLPNF